MELPESALLIFMNKYKAKEEIKTINEVKNKDL